MMTAAAADTLLANVHALNVNVGIMGHVDAGKTSLARFISDLGSTAAFDRHPASQQRGITLDLGFSRAAISRGTVTLVDCPGHGSLLRMVLGAASIIDSIILVVDATAGVQAQTAECLVLAELVTRRLLVALTKVDRLEPESLERVTRSLRRVLRGTVFGQADALDQNGDPVPAVPLVPIVPVSPRLPETREPFLRALEEFLFPRGKGPSFSWLPQRDLVHGPALVAIDHCFTIRGQGAILTGTILRGSLCPGDMVEISAGMITGDEGEKPVLEEKPVPKPRSMAANLRRVKSLQVFRTPVDRARQGDRVGINLGGGLDTSGLERTLLATPGLVGASRTLLLGNVKRIRYYKYGACRSRGRLHLSILHQTTLVTVTFLRRAPDRGDEYELVDELADGEGGNGGASEGLQALISAPVPIVATSGLMVIASKLDIDQSQRQGGAGPGKVCRLVFSATVEQLLRETQVVRVYRWRQRTGTIDRLIDEHRLIGADLSETLAGLRQFIGMECCIVRRHDGGDTQSPDTMGDTRSSPTVARGIISSPFGASGKFSVNLTTPLSQGSRRQDYFIIVRYKKYS